MGVLVKARGSFNRSAEDRGRSLEMVWDIQQKGRSVPVVSKCSWHGSNKG